MNRFVHLRIATGLFLILLIFSSLSGLHAQTVVLEIEEPTDTTTSVFGPNRQHFVHSFFSLGFPVGEQNEGGRIELINSTIAQFGMRYKLRFNDYISTGLELSYKSSNYRLKQEESKRVPDSIQHDKENLVLAILEGGAFLRFNFGKRGDFMGRFIDLGASYDVRLGTQHITKDDLPTGELQEVILRKLRYLNNGYSNAFVRLGFNRLIFNFEYRLTNIFKPEFSYPEFPPYTIGLQLGLHE